MKVIFITTTVLALSACSCDRQNQGSKAPSDEGGELAFAKSMEFDAAAIRADLSEFAAFPHPFGSDRQRIVGDWLKSRATAIGAKVVIEEFVAETPNPAASDPSAPVAMTLPKSGRNIYAFTENGSSGTGSDGCVVLIASHYDTKILSGSEYLGANDSGSSSIALLHMLSHVMKARATLKTTCDIGFVWFDGEEAVLPDWNDGLRHPAKIIDNTYGSRHAVGRTTPCQFGNLNTRCLPPELSQGRALAALILLDMIGSPDIVLTRETNSTAKLMALAMNVSQDLGYPNLFGLTPQAVEDDHIPYIKSGVPAIDLIDFTHLEYWHKSGDDPVRVDPESMLKAARVGLVVALKVANSPDISTK